MLLPSPPNWGTSVVCFTVHKVRSIAAIVTVVKGADYRTVLHLSHAACECRQYGKLRTQVRYDVFFKLPDVHSERSDLWPSAPDVEGKICSLANTIIITVPEGVQMCIHTQGTYV